MFNPQDKKQFEKAIETFKMSVMPIFTKLVADTEKKLLADGVLEADGIDQEGNIITKLAPKGLDLVKNMRDKGIEIPDEFLKSEGLI